MKPLLTLLCLISSFLFSQEQSEILPPEKIEIELRQAEEDYGIAEQMFLPWYTGPLITGSAINLDKGHINLVGYLFFTVNYATFNSHGKSIQAPNTYILNPQFLFQAGITDWLDVTFSPQGVFKWQNDHAAQEFGDTSLQFGIPLLKGSMHIPYIRLILGETFPSGKYKNLNPDKGGIDSSGSGVYATTIGLNISRIFWWLELHPINLRLASNCVLPNNKTKVKGFNTYGGGYGTEGKIKVGNSYNVDFGVEYSINQKWVVANDFVYTYQNKSSFSGIAGTLDAATAATNGTPSLYQFSLAPAIEYNVNSTGGLIAGLWFTVLGRNSSNFVSGILSYTQLF